MVRPKLRYAIILASIMALTATATISAQDSAPVVNFPTLTGPYFGQEPPGDTPKLFAPGIISTGKEHSAAMFTPHGDELWFGRMFPSAVWVSSQENGVWSQPKVAPFSIENRDLYPYLAPGGNTLYFCTARDFEDLPAITSRGDGRLCVTMRSKSGWIEPRVLGAEVNFSDQSSQVASSMAGNLYIASRNPEKPDNSLDLFLFRLSTWKLDPPETFTDIVSSSTPDHSPFIAPDESYLIFSSFRGGLGLSDLFITFRTNDDRWTKPINLGPKINSAAKDEYPYVSPDGKYLFFNSNRTSEMNAKRIPDGPGNIYWVEAGFIERLREEQIR